MHAVVRHLAAFTGAEGHRRVVTRDGNLTAKYKQPRVEVVAVGRRLRIRCQTSIDHAVAVVPQSGFEFMTIHWRLLYPVREKAAIGARRAPVWKEVPWVGGRMTRDAAVRKLQRQAPAAGRVDQRPARSKASATRRPAF